MYLAVAMLLLHSSIHYSNQMFTMNLKSEPTKTVLVVTVGFILVYVLTKWQLAINISIIVGIIGLISNSASKIIHFLWLKMTWVLSLIVPNILLSLVYFLVLVPLAYFYRMFGEQNQLTMNNTEQSLFKESRSDFSNDSFKKMW